MLNFVFLSSGAAVTPDGPAPKGMLANYTVLLTTVPPSATAVMTTAPQSMPPVAPAISRRSSSNELRAGARIVPGEEADVRDAVVDRDVAESIVCRRRYRILPDFGPGDRPYVVRVLMARCSKPWVGWVGERGRGRALIHQAWNECDVPARSTTNSGD